MIEEKVMSIIEEMMSLKREEVYLSANLVNDLGMDSLDVVQFIMELEDEYSVSILDAEGSEEIHTVIDMVNYIKKKTNKERL